MTLTKLPNAFHHLPQLISTSLDQHKTIVLFLDYDGTLSPIVARPELAIMSDESRQVVHSLAQRFTTAIVSGRAKNNVKQLVQLNNLYFAGSHGFDIDGPNDTHYQVATEYIPVLEQLYNDLCEKLTRTNNNSSHNEENNSQNGSLNISSSDEENGGIPGVIIENNLFSLSVHYRLVPSEQLVEQVKQTVNDIVQANEQYVSMVRVTHGKMVLELRANYDWHKGKAVLHLLQCLDMMDSRRVLAIYVGDDKTDEDAFRALNEAGLGVGVLVANGPNDERLFSSAQSHEESPVHRVQGTNANCYVDDCSQVVDLLKQISALE